MWHNFVDLKFIIKLLKHSLSKMTESFTVCIWRNYEKTEVIKILWLIRFWYDVGSLNICTIKMILNNNDVSIRRTEVYDIPPFWGKVSKNIIFFLRPTGAHLSRVSFTANHRVYTWKSPLICLKSARDKCACLACRPIYI